MIRKGFLIQAKPGMAKEYERRHNLLWPELYKVLKEHGVLNYTIFLHEQTNQLFCYVEIENEEKFNAIAENDICKRWWKDMTELLICDSPNANKAKEDTLREIFHID